jgi:hypothetical protein
LRLRRGVALKFPYTHPRIACTQKKKTRRMAGCDVDSIPLQGTAVSLETRMNAGFQVSTLEKYRQKYRHFLS